MNDVVSVGDAFRNEAARSGWRVPNLLSGTSYELSRFSFDYWGLVTLYEDSWICRRIVDAPAEDMVRGWPHLNGDIAVEDITRIEKVIQHTQTREGYLTAMKWGRLFGGAGALIVVDGHEDRLEEPLRPDDVAPGAYKGLIPFDMWSGIQPDGSSISRDFDRPTEANLPEYYRVRMSGGEAFRVHASRILRFTGLQNPTPDREVYQWWGVSVINPVYEEIQKRDNVSYNIVNLTFRANLLALRDKELAARLSGLGSNAKATRQWSRRISEVNRLMSNESLFVLPEDGALETTQYTFEGLSECYQQFQLDLAGGAEIPVSRLWGRTITGLGQSNDADERIYEERIMRDQRTRMQPEMEAKLFPVIYMSTLGEVPRDVTLDFPSIRVLDERERSDLARSVTDTLTVAFNSGIISPRAFAKELRESSKRTGIFTNLTDEDVDALSDKPQSLAEASGGAGLFGEEVGEPVLDPSASPQKTLKEEGREKKQLAFAKDEAEFKESDHPPQVFAPWVTA